MGTDRTTPATTETKNGAAGTRASNGTKWDSLDFTNWSALARFTRTIWKMDDGVQPLSALAEKRSMEETLADQQGELNWDLHFEDRTIIRAHQHAAGAKKAHRKQRHEGAVEVV